MVIALVERACQRRARSVALELRKGLGAVATVAATAAFVGLLASTWGIGNSFVACGGSKSFCLGLIADYIAQSLHWSACGLLLAISAYAAHAHFLRLLDEFEGEMKAATKDLLQALSNRRAFPA